MSLLRTAVAPNTTDRQKPKMVAYGIQGAGKSWVALDFPSPIYIDTEKGVTEPAFQAKLEKSKGMYFGVKQGSQKFSTIIELLKELATTKHQFKTVVIDSFTHIFDMEIAREVERLSLAGTKIEFGIEKKPAIKLAKRMLLWLDQIDMNVIIICHSKIKYELVGGEQKATGTMFDGWDKIGYILNMIAVVTKQGKSRKAFIEKSRLTGIEDASFIDWSYETFAERLGRNFLEGEVKTIELATAEQVAEARELLKTARLTNSENDKWIMENQASFEEVETSKFAGIINHLKTIQTTR